MESCVCHEAQVVWELLIQVWGKQVYVCNKLKPLQYTLTQKWREFPLSIFVKCPGHIASQLATCYENLAGTSSLITRSPASTFVTEFHYFHFIAKFIVCQYVGHSTWKKLPNNLKTSTSVDCFKHDIKKYFLKKLGAGGSWSG